MADPTADLPYGERARKVVELTDRAALRLDHDDVGTEHLLLALLEEESGAGPLSDLGIETSVVTHHLRVALGELDP